MSIREVKNFLKHDKNYGFVFENPQNIQEPLFNQPNDYFSLKLRVSTTNPQTTEQNRNLDTFLIFFLTHKLFRENSDLRAMVNVVFVDFARKFCKFCKLSFINLNCNKIKTLN